MFLKPSRVFLSVCILFSLDALADPQTPANTRNVTTIQDNKFYYPQILPSNTSQDGRIGVEGVWGGYYRLQLLKPENAVVPGHNFMEKDFLFSQTELEQGKKLLDTHRPSGDRHILISATDPVGDGWAYAEKTTAEIIAMGPIGASVPKPVGGVAYIDAMTVVNLCQAGSHCSWLPEGAFAVFGDNMVTTCEKNVDEVYEQIPGTSPIEYKRSVFSRSPYACTVSQQNGSPPVITDGGTSDCYDLTIMTATTYAQDLNGSGGVYVHDNETTQNRAQLIGVTGENKNTRIYILIVYVDVNGVNKSQFKWSTDNFVTYENSGNPIEITGGEEIPLVNGISIKFDYSTGHTLWDRYGFHPTMQNASSFSQLWSRDFKIAIANPKSDLAYIEAVIPQGVKARGDGFYEGPGFPGFMEPQVTNDGKLLVSRYGINKHAINPADRVECETDYETPGDTHLENTTYIPNDTGIGNPKCPFIDVFYSYNPAGACDVTGWTNSDPVSHAYWDSALIMSPQYSPSGRKLYGFAEYQMRSPDGVPLPDNADAKGGYPWVDDEGSNIVLMLGGSQLNNNMYGNKVACLDAACALKTGGAMGIGGGRFDGTFGVSITGLWTSGKTVYVDNILNNTDYGLTLDHTPANYGISNQHVLIDLYGDDSVKETRVGSNRQSIVDTNNSGWPDGGLTNTDLFDSIENRWNFQQEFKPSTFRDVVWKLSNAKATDEFAFDDYVSPNAYIVSEMVPARKYHPGIYYGTHYDVLDGWDDYDYHDGSGPAPVTYTWKADKAAVQNGATTLRFTVPNYGQLKDYVSGDGNVPRTEPVSMGGIKGRGLWLEDSYGVEYQATPGVGLAAETAWYASLFLDPRMNADNQYARLLTFSDGSSIRVKRATSAPQRLTHVGLYDASDTLLQEFSIATLLNTTAISTEKWLHLAFQMSNSGKQVDFYLDGYFVGTWSNATDMLFKLGGSGATTIGATGAGNPGIKGWIDEFKIFAENVNKETICNHAYGSLIGVDNYADSKWQNLANAYPATGHNQITAQLQVYKKRYYAQYACAHDYAGEYKVTPNNLPKKPVAHPSAAGETYSVRSAMHMPEGPLYHDVPRPDSSSNQFCNSCHTTASKGGLKLSALAGNAGWIDASVDPRRQPMQPLQRVKGFIPTGWPIGAAHQTTSSVAHTQNANDYTLIDRLVLDSEGHDADGDGIRNAVEVLLDFDPESRDTDNDGQADNLEMLADTDADGMPDGWEVYFNLSVGTNDSLGDKDGDGLSNALELAQGVICLTQQFNPAIPIDSCISPDSSDANNDADGDGLTNAQEFPATTNPYIADTDGDGYLDGADDFPLKNAASVDTDGDGHPDSWNAGCYAACQTTSGLTLDGYPQNAAKWRVLTRHDYDGDGTSDVMMRIPDTSLDVFHGQWMHFRIVNGVVTSSNPFYAAWPVDAAASLDMDGDSDADILTANSASPFDWIAYLVQSGQQNGVTILSGLQAADTWQFAAAGDFNGDGTDDVLLRNGASWKVYYLQNGAVNSSSDVTALNYDASYIPRAAADFNGDGYADVLFSHDGAGTSRTWYVYNFANNTVVTPAGLNTSPYNTNVWQYQAVVDLNADIKSDVVLRNVWTGAWSGFTMGSNFVSSPYNLSNIATTDEVVLVSYGDFDGNGTGDLLLKNKLTNVYSLYTTIAPGNANAGQQAQVGSPVLTTPGTGLWHILTNGMDKDGDVVKDVDDAFPTDETEWLDTDGDFVGNNADLDDDNDDRSDAWEESVGSNPYSVDTDSDTVLDGTDNCILQSNTNQLDTDADGFGDACDATPNGDTDNDGIDNLADNCPLVANVDQLNTDGDSEGNACDLNDDNDVEPDVSDAFPLDPLEWADTDADGVGNNADNCVNIANASQTNSDADAHGDACDAYPLNPAKWQVPVINDFDGDRTSDIMTHDMMPGGYHGQWMYFRVVNGSVVDSNPFYGAFEVYPSAGIDINGNGVTDIVFKDAASGDWLAYVVQNGQQSGNTAIPLPTSWAYAAAGDFNGDGTDDVLMRNGSSWKVYYLQSGTGGISSSSDVTVLNYDASYIPRGAADFNGDGYTDVLFSHDGAGSSRTWYVYDFVTNTVVTPAGLNTSPYNTNVWQFQAVVDLNADVKVDIVLRSVLTGAWTGFSMGSAFVSTPYNLANLANDPEQVVLASYGDFDGNAIGDLLLRNKSTNVYSLYATIAPGNANAGQQMLVGSLAITTPGTAVWDIVSNAVNHDGDCHLDANDPYPLEAAGELDCEFDGDGKHFDAFTNGHDAAMASLIWNVSGDTDNNGKLVVAGKIYNAGTYGDVGVVRYNTNGTVDTGFGTNGYVTTPVGLKWDVGLAVAQQSNGKLVVAGYSGSDTVYDAIIVARYNTSGTLDTTFSFNDGDGKDGVRIISNAELLGTEYTAASYAQGNSIIVQSDDKIVVAGMALTKDPDGAGPLVSALDGVILRLTDSGALDSTFSGDGVVLQKFGNYNDAFYSVIQQSNGKLVAAGRDGANFALARYETTDGSLDTSFGTGGKTTTDFTGRIDYGYSLTQQDDKLLLVGISGVLSGSQWTDQQVAVARYSATSGLIDTTFATSGTKRIAVPSKFALGWKVKANSAITSDGKIVIVGDAGTVNYQPTPAVWSRDAVVIRLGSNGDPDTAFGTNGISVVDAAGGDDLGRSVEIVNNKIWVVGSGRNGSYDDFMLFRYFY